MKAVDMTPGGLGRGAVIAFRGKNMEEGSGHVLAPAELNGWRAEGRGRGVPWWVTTPLYVERT